MYRFLGFFSALIVLGMCSTATAQLSGNVIYTGTESGKIIVEAFTESDETFEKLSVDMINPGSFEFENVEEGDYNVIAFIDVNGNAIIDTDEPWIDAGEKIEVPPGNSNIELNIDNYSPLGSGDGDDDDDGCCATTAPSRTPIWVALLGFIAIGIRRRQQQLGQTF